jgi:hypothetical protein
MMMKGVMMIKALKAIPEEGAVIPVGMFLKRDLRGLRIHESELREADSNQQKLRMMPPLGRGKVAVVLVDEHMQIQSP